MYKKILSLSIIILIIISAILIIEIISWLLINNFSKTKSSFLFYKKDNIQEQCAKFIFDLQLSHIHDESYDCDIDQGEARQGFIFYNHKGTEKTNFNILTLGGSTTDGYFKQPKNEGKIYRTWPFWLSEYCGVMKKCSVINGGIGGYSTSHILRKFLRDVTIMQKKPDLIILYTGINDYPGHSGPLELIYPYYDKYQIDAIIRGKYVSRFDVKIIPSSMRVINYIFRNLFNARIDNNTYFQDEIFKKKSDYYSSLPKADFKEKTELFAHNINLLKKFSQSLNIELIVFLEPTMGLDHEILDNYSKNDLKLRKEFNDDYYKMLNKHYKKIRKFCKKINYCFDISKVIRFDGEDKFVDPRHPNGQTHKKISLEIIDILYEQNYLKN